jgi:two-component system osmolarity sensor histidine kinase EnvZ
MRLLPKSLWGRTALILILTVVLSQLATTAVMRSFYIEPLRDRSLANRINHIDTVAAALALLPLAQHADFIKTFQNNQHVKIVLATPGLDPGVPPEPGSRLSLLEERLRSQISENVRVLVSRDAEASEVWIFLPTQKTSYWYVITRLRLDSVFPENLAILLLVGIILSVLIAFWGVRRLNQPLMALTNAAHSIAMGEMPAPIAETGGAKEIHDLSVGFNLMQKALRDFESNRVIMLAGVSHDLRTPLSRLRLAVEMSVPESDPHLASIVQDLEEIDGIINQFLDFARDNPSQWLSPGNPNDVVRVVCERFAARGCDITQEIDSTAPDILMNERALERVITNLIENALHYGKAPVTIRTETFPNHVRLSVLDRGAGIPPHEVLRLVQPFTRLETSRSGHPGAGLGLAIVDRVARLHRGVLKLLPRQGGGLDARLELPLKKSG